MASYEILVTQYVTRTILVTVNADSPEVAIAEGIKIARPIQDADWDLHDGPVQAEGKIQAEWRLLMSPIYRDQAAFFYERC